MEYRGQEIELELEDDTGPYTIIRWRNGHPDFALLIHDGASEAEIEGRVRAWLDETLRCDPEAFGGAFAE